MTHSPASISFGRIRCHVEPDGRVRRMSLDGDSDPGAGWIHADALVELGDLVAVDGGPGRYGHTDLYVNPSSLGYLFG